MCAKRLFENPADQLRYDDQMKSYEDDKQRKLKEGFNPERFGQLKENPDDLDRQTNMSLGLADKLLKKCVEQGLNTSFYGKEQKLFYKAQGKLKEGAEKLTPKDIDQEIINIDEQLKNISKDKSDMRPEELRFYLETKKAIYNEVKQGKTTETIKITGEYKKERGIGYDLEKRDPELFQKAKELTTFITRIDDKDRAQELLMENIDANDPKILQLYKSILYISNNSLAPYNNPERKISDADHERINRMVNAINIIKDLWSNKLAEMPLGNIEAVSESYKKRIEKNRNVLTKDSLCRLDIQCMESIYQKAISKKRVSQEQVAIKNIRGKISMSQSVEKPTKEPESKKPEATEKIIWTESDNANLRALTKNTRRKPEERYALHGLLNKQIKHLREIGRNDLANQVDLMIGNIPRPDSRDLPLNRRAEIDRQYNL